MPNPRERGIFSGSRVTQTQVPTHSLTQAAERVALALQGWMGLFTVHHQSLSPASQNVQRGTVFSPLTQRSQGLQWINKEIALGHQLQWSGQVLCSGGAQILRGPHPSAQWEQDPRDKQSIVCVRMHVCSHLTWLPQVVTSERSVEDQSDMSKGSWVEPPHQNLQGKDRRIRAQNTVNWRPAWATQ